MQVPPVEGEEAEALLFSQSADADEPIKFIRLRDPRGSTGFSGAWSVDSELWRSYGAAVENIYSESGAGRGFLSDAAHGVFTMEFEEFAQRFGYIMASGYSGEAFR